MINRIKKGSKEDKVLGGLFGLAVGDALGSKAQKVLCSQELMKKK